jgi:alpha-mannosidase
VNAKIIESQILRLQRFIERAQNKLTPHAIPMQAEFAWSKDPVPFDQRLDLEYKPASVGDLWGHSWESAWFHLRGVIPNDWAGKQVMARLDFSGEGLVFTPDGRILQGICTRSIFDPYFIRDLVPLYTSCQGGEEIELWVEAAANSLFGVFTEPDPALDSPLRYGQFDAKVNAIKLCTFDALLWALILDLKVSVPAKRVGVTVDVRNALRGSGGGRVASGRPPHADRTRKHPPWPWSASPAASPPSPSRPRSPSTHAPRP